MQSRARSILMQLFHHTGPYPNDEMVSTLWLSSSSASTVAQSSQEWSKDRNGSDEQHCHCNCALRAGTHRSSIAGDSDHRFKANWVYQIKLLQHRSVWVVRAGHKAPHHKQARIRGYARSSRGLVWFRPCPSIGSFMGIISTTLISLKRTSAPV